MKKYLRGWGAFSVSLFLFFSIAASVSYFVSGIFIAPITLTRLSVRSDTIKLGEDLHPVIEFNRTKICRTSADRFLLKLEDGHVIETAFRQEVPAVLELGPNKIRTTIPLSKESPPLPVGDYKLVISVFSACGFMNRVDTYDPIIIHVVE